MGRPAISEAFTSEGFPGGETLNPTGSAIRSQVLPGPNSMAMGMTAVTGNPARRECSTYRFNENDAERTAALDRDFLTLLEKWNEATEPGRTVYAAEYLLVTAIKG